MARHIPETFISDLLARVDVVDVVNDYVTLKKRGANHIACCPFHQEKTPSFTVNQQKQFYYCFGCGVHGNAIGFLMEYAHMDFVDAVEEIARKQGLEIPYEEGQGGSSQQNPYRDGVYETLQKTKKYYSLQLRHHSEAVTYLKSRGLTGEIAKEYGIGFAPQGWDNLLQQFGGDKDNIAYLEKAGLLIKKDSGGFYDRFRHRIMFPISDRRGRVIGFGGRVMSPAEQPKYLNSPETMVFHKGYELYGFYEAAKSVKDFSNILIVEGYMDVIALAQHGIKYAVATLGTATTADHLRFLLKHTDKVTFCFDGDRAGREAAWRALKVSLSFMTGEKELNFLFLPEGCDPDDLIREKGKEFFENMLAKAPTLSQFLLKELRRKADLGTLEGRAKLITSAVSYLRPIPYGPYLSSLYDELSRLTRIPVNQIQKEVEKKASEGGRQESKFIVTDSGFKRPIERALTWLIQYPSLANLVASKRLPEDDNDRTLCNKLIEFILQTNTCNTAVILEKWKNTQESQRFAKFATSPVELSKEQLEIEFQAIIEVLGGEDSNNELEDLIAKARNGALSDKEKEIFRKLISQNKK